MQVSNQQKTRVALLESAQRLFAEKGLGGVSVRDITRAAGAKNESALHYHFGGLESLIREVFAGRYADIEKTRLARLQSMEGSDPTCDLQAIIEAAVSPLFEACLEEEGRLYIRFCVQLITDPRFSVDDIVVETGMQSASLIQTRVRKALAHISEPTINTRLRRVFPLSVMLAADHARLVEKGDAPPIQDAIREAGRSLSGFLSA